MSGFRKVGICPFNPSAISVIELPPGHDSFLQTSYLPSVSEPTPSLSGPNQDNPSENESEAELYDEAVPLEVSCDFTSKQL